MTTMADYLFDRARSGNSHQDILCFWGDSSGGESWSWAELWKRASAVGGSLKSHGVEAGSHVLMLVPEPDDAVACLFGIWSVGAIPAQLGLSSVSEVSNVISQIADVVARIDAKMVVISSRFSMYIPGSSDLPLSSTNNLLRNNAPLERPVPGPETAFIQLTSGTVSKSRGAVITNEALSRQLDSLRRVIPVEPGAVGVSWLPLYHDMGLVGGLLFPLVSGMRLHLASPLDFRQRPYAWLEILSRVEATHTVGSPAAYALAARLASRAKADGLRFDKLGCALVSADRIAPTVMRHCMEQLAECGLRAKALVSAYGLAEATLAVTVDTPGQPLRFDAVNPEELIKTGRAVPSTSADAVEFTSAGKPVPGAVVKIVDDWDSELGERQVGNIVVQSSSVMTGYYEDVDRTAEALKGGRLRTGDLGYLDDGHLFVTGRRKEIIISAGRNIYPCSIEEVAATVPQIRTGCVAAVGVPTEERSTDLVVVVAETKMNHEGFESLRSEIKKALSASDLFADCVVLTSPGSLPKTSSGKTRRTEVRRLLMEGDHPEFKLPQRLRVQPIPRHNGGHDGLVSIVVANYNYGSYIEEALDSCVRQSHGRIEVLVGDDGSQDDSVAKINRFMSIYCDRFERIVPMFFKENRGKIAVLNSLLASVRGDHVVILDADDYLTVNYLTRMLDVLKQRRREDPKVAFVYTDCLLVDAHGKFVSRGVSRDFDAEVIGSQSYIPECALVTAEATAQLLPMDEHIRKGTKHYKWSKVIGQGWRGHYDPDPGFFYRMHDKNLSGIGTRVMRDLAEGGERLSILTGYWPTQCAQPTG